MEAAKLVDSMFGRPVSQGVSLATVVMHRGEVIVERYGTQPATIFTPESLVTAETTLPSWSVAKSVTHAAVGVLVGDGLIELDAAVAVPEWVGTDRASITLLDLLEMRSGLHFVEDYVDGEASNCIAMLFGDGANDHAAYASQLPLDHQPGTFWNYSSGSTNIICRLLGQIVGGGQQGMTNFLKTRIFDPLGMNSAIPRFDDAGTWVGSSYLYATARDFAKFGEMYRCDGFSAAGERVLRTGWADHGRTSIAHDPADGVPGGFDYGRHWWAWPQFPGSICAHGYEGQYIVVVPDRELTIVHLGKTEESQRNHLVAELTNLVRSFPAVHSSAKAYPLGDIAH